MTVALKPGLGLLLVLGLVAVSQAQMGPSTDRSTLDTIPLQSMEQDALAETVIEGGLAPLDADAPQGFEPEPLSLSAENVSPFSDPLRMPIEDHRSGFNRFSLNFEINYQDRANIPGIEFGNSYNIAPLPSNRTYDFYEFSTTER